MVRILTYSVLLIVGMVLSQLPAIDHLKPQIAALTMIFLAYIMIQVGMEFEIDKNDLRKYGVDYLVAMAAAAVPWLTAAALAAFLIEILLPARWGLLASWRRHSSGDGQETAIA